MGSPHVLLLDSQILWWVFLPIAVVMLLIALGRHYATLLIQVTPQSTRDQIQKTQLLRRSQRLRMHSHFLPEAAWAMRQRFLVSKALIKPAKPAASAEADAAASAPEMPQQDPMAMMGMLKGQMLMIVPQMASMAWVSYFFSGFVVGKLPFSLTQRFKVMLQRGIAIKTLDSSYVSSLSWYFLNMLGLQGLVALILGGASEGSDAKMMQQQMQGQLMPGQPQQPDLGPMIDAERNEVEITKSNFLVPAVEKRLLAERRAAVAPRFAPAPKPQQ